MGLHAATKRANRSCGIEGKDPIITQASLLMQCAGRQLSCMPTLRDRQSHNVQFALQGRVSYGEVQYHFHIKFPDNICAFTMVSCYSPPDKEFWACSLHTVWSCTYQGQDTLTVIPIQDIHTVISMIPHIALPDKDTHNLFGRLYVCDKMGLEIQAIGGFQEADDEENMLQEEQDNNERDDRDSDGEA